MTFPCMLLLDLPDDAVYLILSFIADARSLSATAACCQRSAALCDRSLWHSLLSAHLRRADWAIHGVAIALSKADTARLLLTANHRPPWIIPRATARPSGHPSSSSTAASATGTGPLAFAAAPALGAFAGLASLPAIIGPHGLPSLPAAYLQASGQIAPQPPPLPQPPLPTGGSHSLPPSAGGAALTNHVAVAADGLAVRFVGERLGGNRAVRCEPPLPSEPFDALRFSKGRQPPPPLASERLAIKQPMGEASPQSVAVHLPASPSLTPVGRPHDHPPADANATNAADAATRLGRGADEASGRWGWEVGMERGCSVVYYEVSIESPCEASAANAFASDGGVDCIAVGLGGSAFPLTGRQPGWDTQSYGYHSDDGNIFHGSGTRSQSFGPRFGVGDVVGCGLALHTRQLFFTLNGAFLGTAFTLPKSAALPLYPVVGLDSHASVHFNFGQRPFSYDVATLPAQVAERNGGAKQRTSPSLPTPWNAASPAARVLRSLAAVFGRH